MAGLRGDGGLLHRRRRLPGDADGRLGDRLRAAAPGGVRPLRVRGGGGAGHLSQSAGPAPDRAGKCLGSCAGPRFPRALALAEPAWRPAGAALAPALAATPHPAGRHAGGAAGGAGAGLRHRARYLSPRQSLVWVARRRLPGAFRCGSGGARQPRAHRAALDPGRRRARLAHPLPLPGHAGPHDRLFGRGLCPPGVGSNRFIVAWAHGTIGLAPNCAPARLVTGPAISPWRNAMLARGWVGTAPDYVGAGEPAGPA